MVKICKIIICNKRDSDPLRCNRPDLVRISTTTGPNLQDVLIGLDATSKVQTEIRRGQFDSTGCGDGGPGLL